MKRIMLNLFIFCGLFSLVSAQDKIVINFSNKTIKLPTTCKEIKNIKKNGYYIEIININLNMFKVFLTSVDTILSKPQQTPAFGNFNLDAISKIVAGISPISTPALKAQLNPVETNKYVKNTMQNYEDTIALTKFVIERLAEHIDSLKLKVYMFKLNSLKLDSLQNKYNFDIDSALSYVRELRDSISHLKIMIIINKARYEGFVNSNLIEIAKDLSLVARDKLNKESYNNLLITMTDALTSISADKTNELLSPIVFIKNNKDNAYLSLPFQFLGEQAKIKISIVPRDEKYNLQSYYTQIVFPQKVKNYIVVGLSFYGSNLCDSAYSTIESQAKDSIYIKKEENVSKRELGIAALLHFGTKFGYKCKLGAHFSLGAGISISDKIKPRFLGGGGFSCGEKHKLVIDGGLIVGYVNRRSSNTKLSQEYSKAPENITISTIDFGYFASIGYVYQF
jgi:hypothetical protein